MSLTQPAVTRSTPAISPRDEAETINALQARIESLTIVNGLADALFQTVSPETVARRAIDAIIAYTGAPSVAVFTLDGDRLQMLASHGFAPEVLQVGTRLPLKGSLTGLTISRKSIMVAAELATDDRLDPAVRQALAASGLAGSVISVPLLYQKQALGAINLIFDGPHVADAAERELLLSIGRVIALALTNAQYVARIEAEIAERKRAQQELEAQRAFLRQVIDLDPNFVFARDRDGRFTLVNKAFAAALGTTPEALVNRKSGDLPFGPAELARFREEDLPLLDRREERFIAEEPFVDATGALHWLQTIKRPIADPDGQANQLLAVSTDLTARKQVEEALAIRLHYEEQLAATSQALLADQPDSLLKALHALREAAHVGRVYIFENFEDPGDGLCIRQAWEACAPGVSPQIDNPELQHLPYDLAGFRRWRETLSDDQPITGLVADLPDGERDILAAQEILAILVLPIWVGNRWYGFIGFDETERAREWGDEDIRLLRTAAAMIGAYLERKQAEEDRQRFSRILEATTDFVAIADPAGRLVFVNQAGRRMIGLRATAALESAQLADFMPDWAAERVATVGAATAVQHGSWQEELALTRPDGTERPVSLLLLAHSGDDGQLQYLSAVARDITAQKQLTQQTRESLARRSREVQLTTRITQQIAAATALPELYRQVVNLVKEEFGYYHTQLLRFDPAGDRLVLEYGYGEIGQAMREARHSMPLGVGLIGQAAAQKRPVLRPAVTGDLDWAPNALLPATQGELAVPIQLRDRILGVLDVQSDRAGQLSEEDQLVLEGLCGQIAIAIESTQLRQAMEERLAELDKLQRLLRREGWQEYWLERPETAAAYTYDRHDVLPLPAEQLATKNGRQHTRPIAVRGEVIGALGIVAEPDQPLTPEEEALLASISDQVAEALEAARLFEQTQAALARQEQLTGELETVAEVSINASTILDERTLLQSVVDLTRERFGFYHVHIYTADAAGQQLTLRAGAGKIGRMMVAEGHVIPLDAAALVARAARTREVVVENDVSQAPDFLPHPLLPKTRAEMAVPMIVGDTLMGVLDVQADQPGVFAGKDRLIQQTLASQVAVALQNAYLYAEQLATAEQLREVDRLKSEFLASMSHELRTPLNSIIGFADVLLEGLDGELNPRMEEDVTLIRDSGRHLRELIGNILDMSKIEAGMMTLRYETIDVPRLADEVIGAARILAQEKRLELELAVGDTVRTIMADRTRLMQILLNLVSNAIKFTEQGRVTLSMETVADGLLVQVSDSGIGIRPEDVPIIFEQFRQLDGSLTRKSGGTGLGLPISRKLVELHGGEIGVESQVGLGSTFWFKIPHRRTVME